MVYEKDIFKFILAKEINAERILKAIRYEDDLC